MPSRHPLPDRIARDARAFAFFGWWYFADGAKEAAPA
jgi:hypothetical protein